MTRIGIVAVFAAFIAAPAIQAYATDYRFLFQAGTGATWSCP